MSIDIELPSKQEKGPKPKPARKPEKEPKPLNRVSDKQRVRIKANKSYYKLVMETKPHVCENCGEKIINASGRNVSHILSGGSNPALYHDEENNYLLCDLCEHVWTNGDKTKMRIYLESEEIAERLKLRYYERRYQKEITQGLIDLLEDFKNKYDPGDTPA